MIGGCNSKKEANNKENVKATSTTENTTTNTDALTQESTTLPETSTESSTINSMDFDLLSGHCWGETPTITQNLGYATEFLGRPILTSEDGNPRIKYTYTQSDELTRINLYLKDGSSEDYDSLYNDICDLYGKPHEEGWIDEDHQKVEWIDKNGDSITIIEVDGTESFEGTDLYLATKELRVILYTDQYGGFSRFWHD